MNDVYIDNCKDGYVIKVYRNINGHDRWMPIINFGERQGDAKDFIMYDIEKLEESFITARIKDYDSKRLYKRISSLKYAKQ